MAVVPDFVVITVLRATNAVIKEMCVATLFNLLSHEGFRQECIREGGYVSEGGACLPPRLPT